MSSYDLTTDDGLLAACQAIGPWQQWATGGSQWIRLLSETLQWVKSADESQRASREFQQRLWEKNNVAAVGQGQIPVDRALDDEGFRKWLSGRSMQALPPKTQDRLHFLTDLYRELKESLQPFLEGVTPHLKIFRVIAALYPEGMTTVASTSLLHKLTKAMGSSRTLEPVERHVWTRERLDRVLGDPGPDPTSLAERMSLAWMLFERFVQAPPGTPGSTPPRVSAPTPVNVVETPGHEAPTLKPLPAARRRRGLTAIRGLFPGMLSTLEFVRDGVTRPELLEFLRAASPDAKETSLGVTVNCLQSELAVIKADGDRYVLTEQGEEVLESQDPTYLADWLLTRILGPDRALVEIRDRGPQSVADLSAAIQSMNPGWSTTFVPQSIIGWLRSMGVVELGPENKLSLTKRGQQWAARIVWTPEPLSEETPTPPSVAVETQTGVDLILPDLPSIVRSVEGAGHFPAALVAQLHAGLWSHPRRHFAILTGLSGSGKTLLARSYGNALNTAQLFTLPVQPGWYDPGALLGYVNPLRHDSYVRTAFLEFLTKAAGNPSRPYVAVLDEMNLSHPEQYMAPLLSAMETGEPIVLHTEDDIFDGVPARLPYPTNLAFIGTVNMDETTHGLSDKVLDRAFVLEFWHVDLDDYPRWGKKSLEPTLEHRARLVLAALMEALTPARLHFGWRIVDDVLDFLGQATAGGAMSADIALDAVVYAKVLPKLRGEDSPRFREALARCEVALASAGLARSRDKVAELKRDVETMGTARFWR